MTTTLAASAPGKVVLTGEYAVLDGAPAIAMAVNRRATVRFEAGPPAVHCVGAVDEGDSRLFDSVAATVGFDTSDGDLTLDTTAFVAADTGRKLGIGSSAALTVALVGTLASLSGGREEPLEALAYRAHERLQDGAGSGVDIATSLAGGLVEYRRSGRSAVRLDWPDGLHMALISTRVAASTRTMLAKLDLGTADFQALGDAASEAAEGWSSGDAAQVVATTRRYLDTLIGFDRGHQLGVLDGGHDRLVEACTSPRLVYKPCGAGGGDVGVVLGTNAEEVKAFAAAAAGSGYGILEARMDTNGLAVSRTRR